MHVGQALQRGERSAVGEVVAALVSGAYLQKPLLLGGFGVEMCKTVEARATAIIKFSDVTSV